MSTKRTTMRFPPDIEAKLKALKDRTGASVQFSVLAAVRAYLDRPDIKAQLKKVRA